jgi:hypothetical protein
MKLPTVKFLIIGSMKSGTTSLSDYLSLNHEISMCKPKEPQFFSRNYNKGIEYYESLWADGNKICGEASTCYSRWPFYDAVPEKIASYNSNMKLIYLLRHPVDRAYSHYRHNVLNDGISYSSFDDAIVSSDEILKTSMYMQQLEKFLEYFPQEQILLVGFEELKQNPLFVINKIEDFIGAKRTLKINSTGGEIISNQAGVAGSQRSIRRFLDKVRYLPIMSFLVENLFNQKSRKIIREKMNYYIFSSNLVKKYASLKSNRLQVLQQQERKEFLSKLLPDIIRLEEFWGKELSKWKI